MSDPIEQIARELVESLHRYPWKLHHDVADALRAAEQRGREAVRAETETEVARLSAEVDRMVEAKMVLGNALEARIKALEAANEDLDDICDGLRTKLAEAGRAEGRAAWQPIATAPKDGSAVLGFGVHTGSPPDAQRGVKAGDYWWAIMLWDIWRGHPWVFAKDGKPTWSEPTHWMPLPAAPGAETEGRATLEHASKLLALSLTDEMLDSLRADYGNTNAGVLRHWRSEVLAALPAAPGAEDQP